MTLFFFLTTSKLLLSPTSRSRSSSYIRVTLEMGRKRHATTLETTPDLAFVSKGVLNMILMKGDGDELMSIETSTQAFLDDRRLVKSSNMDQILFQKQCTFKVTLEFMEAMMCIPETAVRESTDWVLCSCSGANTYYSKVEERLVLQQCQVVLQSNIEELEDPFILVLLHDEDQWVVERVLR